MTYSNAKKGKRITREKIKRFNVMVDPTLLDELDQFCLDNNYKRNQLMDVMLTEFLDKWGTPDTKVNTDRPANALSQSIRNEKEAEDFLRQLKAVQDSQKK
mgnify:CR=1 FL=1